MVKDGKKNLIDKLGIQPNQSILFVNAPEEYFSALGHLPRSLKLPTEHADFIHAFYTDKLNLLADAPLLVNTLADKGTLWASWPKKSQRLTTSSLSERDFRDTLLPFGLVDTKVCAVTDVWSGLKFVKRKAA